MGQEKRAFERVDWNREGRIIPLAGGDSIDCLVKDISQCGARLVLSFPEVVPDYFRLYYGVEDLLPKCRVRWRKAHEIGVEFFQD